MKGLITLCFASLISYFSFGQDNDDCAGAFSVLTDGTPTTSMDVTTYSSSGNNLSCDGGSSSEDAYYSFIAPASGSVVIDVDNSGLSGSFTAYVEGALYASCADAASNTEVQCFPWSNDLTGDVLVSGLTGGATYILEVEHYNNDWTGTYDVTIIDPSPAINAFTSTCFDLSTASHLYDLGDGGDDYDCGFASAFSGSTDDQVSYTYTPSSNETVDLVIDNVVTSSGDFAVAIFDNTSGTPVSCLGGGQTSTDVTYSGISLTAGTEYIIIIGGQLSTQNSSGCLTIQPQCSPTYTNTLINDCSAATYSRTLNFSNLGGATNIVIDDAEGTTYGTTLAGISTSTDYSFSYTDLSNRTLTISGYDGLGSLTCQETVTLESECVSDVCTDAIDILDKTVNVDLTTAAIDGDLSTIAMGNGVTFANCNALGHSAYYHSDYADLWYVIDIPNGTNEFTVTVTGSSCDIAVIPYTGACGSLTLLDISGSSSANSCTGGQAPFISGDGSFRFFDDGQTDIATASTSPIYIRVMAHDDSQDNSGPSWCDFLSPCSFNITASAPQPNDVCGDAIDIDGVASSGNLCSANIEVENSETGYTCAESVDANDLWYKVTMDPSDNDQLLQVDLTFTNATDAVVVELYSNCFTNTFLECATINSTGVGSTVSHQFSSTITAGGFGPDWLVRVVPVGSNSVCDFTIEGQRIAENNDCEIADEVFPTAFTITNASVVDFNFATASGVSGDAEVDLWYVFDPASNTDVYGHNVYSTDADVTVSGLGGGEEITLMLYKRHGSSGNCLDFAGDYLSTLTVTSNGTTTLSCLDEVHGTSGTGDGYVVRILQTAGGTSAAPTVTITPSVAIPPYNNSCENIWNGTGPSILGSTGIDAAHSFNAYVILDGETISGDFTGSTDCDAGISSSDCNAVSNDPVSSSDQRDMWYVFSVPSETCPGLATSTVIDEMTFTYDASNAFRDGKLYVYSNCGDGNLVDCSPALDGAGDSWTATGLTQGESYLLRVKPYHLNSDFDYSFDITLNNGVVRPCNDEKSGSVGMGAIETGFDRSICPSSTYSALGASSSGVNADGWSDVWFTFVAPNNGGPYVSQEGYVSVFLDAVSGHTMKCQIYDATGTTELATSTTNTEDDAWAHAGHLTPGDTYYVRIAHNELETTSVDYRLCFYQSDAIDGCPITGVNEVAGGIECGNDCSLFYKVDLPEQTPSGYYRFEVIGNGIDVETRLRYQGSDSPSTDGDLTDYDHPCNAAANVGQLSTGVLTDPGSCAGGTGEWDVYNIIGPATGQRNFYYLEVYDAVDVIGCGGLDVCEVRVYGPFSTQALAEDPSNTVPDGSCIPLGCTNSTPTGDASQSFCTIDSPTIADLTVVGGATIVWYDASSAGTAYTSTDQLVSGTSYWAADETAGCNVSSRLEVAVVVSDTTSPTGDASQSFCTIDSPTVADLVASGNNIKWYDNLGALLASGDALTDGAVYSATQESVLSGCESSTTLDVTVAINDPLAPTGDAAQSFCTIDSPTVADLVATGSSIQWYSASTGGSALLTTASLTTATTYYASQTTGGCESSTRLAVTVTLNDPSTPTGDAAQSFCTIDSPTVADLVATGSSIQWYSASTGGSALLTTASLTTATTYYASQTTAGCESSTRLAVAVTLNDPSAPTGDGAQNFCLVDTPNPTVADLSATGTGVQWYSDALATNLLLSTDALVDGAMYYATQTISGCEGSSTLDVLVAISNSSKPGGDPIQSFCIIDNATPTVGDLTATGTTIEWYSESGAINLLANTVPLVNGTNYYALDAGNTSGCAGETLEVSVEISDTTSPTGGASQSFCTIDSPTVADLVASGNNIQWYDNLGALLAPGDALTDGAVYSATQESVLSGCESSTTLDVTVTLNDPFAPTTADVSPTFCLDENPLVSDISITGNGILWYSDVTNTTLVNTTDALIDGNTYYATQTDIINGCESSSSLAVTISLSNPILDTTNHVMNQATCANSDGAITGVTVSSGQANYTWQWSNATGVVDNSQDLTNISAGSYTVVVTDAVGCQDSVQGIIVENTGGALIDISSASFNNETCSNDNGSITNIVVSGGNGNLTYEWSDGTSVVSTDLILQPINEGDYTLTVTDALGCGSISGPFEILDLAGPTLDLNSLVVQNTGCEGANGSISGIQVNGGNGTLIYDWSNGTASIGSALDLSNLLAGNYTLTVTDEENCTVTLDTSLIANQTSTVLANDDVDTTQSTVSVEIDIYANDIGNQSTIVVLSGPYNGSASMDLSGKMTYTPDPNFSGVDSVLYSICDEFCNTICDEAYVYITVIKKKPFRIPNGFSPNEDGFNDTFVIEGLEQYPNNEIIIFNRWGDRVYSSSPYLNDWNGTATNNELKITGEQVTEGTYYYILDLHVEGMDLFNGFIELRINK